jgi:hypothetical protein
MGTQVGELPAAVDLLLYAGDDFRIVIDVTDGADAPVDLTGHTPKAQIRATTDAAAPLVAFAATVAANAVTLVLTSVQTTALPATAVWDVQLTDPAAVVTTLAYGKVSTTPEVTR